MTFDIDKRIKHWLNELKNKLDEVNKTKPIIAEIISKIIDDNKKTLYKKWKQLVYCDDYGNWFYDRFYNEVNYFIENVMLRDEVLADYNNNAADYNSILSCLKSDIQIFRKNVEFTNENVESFFDMSEKIYDMVVSAISQYEQELIEGGLDLEIENVSPVEFECFCANILNKNGWNARLTKRTGDQGVDVVATSGGAKAVFQCKKYSQPVGNGAVQEIIAGKQFEQANIAAVITTSSYTNSARELAGVTGVHLLHYYDLEQFAKRFGEGNEDLSGQHTVAKNGSLPLVCPYCRSDIEINFEDLPHKGKEKEIPCPKCLEGLDMQLRDEDYSCQGCGIPFNAFKEKMDHHQHCEILKKRAYLCAGCGGEKVLEDSEFDELEKIGKVRAVCSCGYKTKCVAK